MVLENLAHGFQKPNILDVKLGTVLYDEEATPEKRERMESKARYTTSEEVGIRLTGFQVRWTIWLMAVSPRTRPCRSLVTKHDNLSSFRRNMENPFALQSFLRGSHVFSLSIHWCEVEPNVCLLLTYTPHTLRGLPGTLTGEQIDIGLPSALLVPILRSIRKSVQEIRDSLSSIELRLVGSSLLIIYEGDWDRAETGVQWLAEQPASMSSEGEDVKEQEIYEDTEEDVEEGWGEDEESEEGSSDEGGESPCVVRLIDFAHTRLKPGQGPDVGVLKGLDNLLALLDGRIASLS